MLLVRSGFQVKAVHKRSRNELAIEHFPIPTPTVGSYLPPALLACLLWRDKAPTRNIGLL
jgi:hypothetical protein